MYLATLSIVLDLDPSFSTGDTEGLLRIIKDKIKQKFPQQITIKANEEEQALVIAFFDKNHARMKKRISDLQQAIEDTNEARIASTKEQIFMWFDGQFTEVGCTSLQGESFALSKSEKTPQFLRIPNKTIKYKDAEEEEDEFTPIPSRFTRRNYRIPTRK